MSSLGKHHEPASFVTFAERTFAADVTGLSIPRVIYSSACSGFLLLFFFLRALISADKLKRDSNRGETNWENATRRCLIWVTGKRSKYHKGHGGTDSQDTGEKGSCSFLGALLPLSTVLGVSGVSVSEMNLVGSSRLSVSGLLSLCPVLRDIFGIVVKGRCCASLRPFVLPPTTKRNKTVTYQVSRFVNQSNTLYTRAL